MLRTSIVQRVSTPPFVTLPRGVQRTDFVGGHSHLAGLIAYPASTSRGTILLIPGFTGSKEDFIALIPYLRDLGYTVASYDQRGQYESPGPDTTDGYAMDDFLSDALAVTGALAAESEARVHLLGHSFGGLVARAAAVRQLGLEMSEGAPPLYSSLILLSSGPAAVPGDLQVVARQLVSLLPHTPLREIWEQKETADRANGWSPPSDEVHNFLKHRFTSNNPHALSAKAEILIEIDDAIDVLADLAATAGLPTLVAYGENDDRWPPDEQELMAHRLGARRLRWPNAAHSPNAEQPEMCAAGLEAFLADVASTTARAIAFPDGRRGYTSGMELRAPVASTPEAVGPARRAVVRQLEAWGLDDAVDDMQIVASELITNAIRYGANPVEIRLSIHGACIRLEVIDGNTSDIPQPRQATDEESTGRGMPLIDALTSDWGVDVHDSDKVVWAELAIPG